MSDVSSIAAYLSRDIISPALRRLEAIWRDGYRQAKTGVTLSHFYPSGVAQLDMFSQQLPRASTDTLMAAIDQINRSGMGKV
jgi:DNA polymerase V